MTVTTAVDAAGISKRYAERDALRDVTFAVPRGAIHALLGPNGAGKTTLLRVLLGLVRADTGTVCLLGRSTASVRSVPDAVAGFVESSGFYPYLSGRKNLVLLTRLDGARRAQRGEIDEALAQVGLERDADVRVGAYSAGMRQRLGLAAALLRAPQLLLLDEPTSALDPSGARDVRALAQRLTSAGAAVILSSHDMNEVEELCASATILNRGRVVFSGLLDELRARADATFALHTSDDTRAAALASSPDAVAVSTAADGQGVTIPGTQEGMDAYIVRLGRAGVAVRRLQQRSRSLERVFLELTASRQ
jgi:ABC-2 type transport system ATP-binding protein